MKLSIIGCPEKKKFRPYVKKAALFYADLLFTQKMTENLFLQIKFNKKIDVFGYASITGYNDSGKPRDFLVELNPNVAAYDILKTLAHEMVHVKQYAYSEMDEKGTRWKGSHIDPSKTDYWTEPWEVEAYGLEPGMFTKFAVKEKLWTVFKNVTNPNDAIKLEPLGWSDETDVAEIQQIENNA